MARPRAVTLLDRRSPTLLRLPLGPELPPVLHRPGRLPVGELDADGGRDLADSRAHRQRLRGRPDDCPPVPADPPLRGVGRDAGGPDPKAPAPDPDAGADGHPPAGPARRDA